MIVSPTPEVPLMLKSPNEPPAGSERREELFQIFGRFRDGSTRPIGWLIPGTFAKGILKGMTAARQPGEIFWLEKVVGAVGGPGGVGTKNDEIEHPEYHTPTYDLDIHPMSRLDIKDATRVCAATPYRRSHAQGHRPHIRQGLGSWLDGFLGGDLQWNQRWLIGAVVILWAIVALILIIDIIMRL